MGISSVFGLVGLLSLGSIATPDVMGGRQEGSFLKSAEGVESPAGLSGASRPGSAAVHSDPRYIPEQNPTKARAITMRMWGILTAAKCWHRQGSSDNYTFSGVNNYRYAGYETTAGQIGLNSVGAFGGHDMADVMISHTRYWIGIANARTIAMSFIHDNGRLVTNWFTAATPSQHCV